MGNGGEINVLLCLEFFDATAIETYRTRRILNNMNNRISPCRPAIYKDNQHIHNSFDNYHVRLGDLSLLSDRASINSMINIDDFAL